MTYSTSYCHSGKLLDSWYVWNAVICITVLNRLILPFVIVSNPVCQQITSRSIVLFEKPTIYQLVKIFAVL